MGAGAPAHPSIFFPLGLAVAVSECRTSALSEGGSIFKFGPPRSRCKAREASEPHVSRRSVQGKRARQARAECRGGELNFSSIPRGQEPPPTPPFSFPLGLAKRTFSSRDRTYSKWRKYWHNSDDLVMEISNRMNIHYLL